MKRNNAKSLATAFAVACALVVNVTPMSAGKPWVPIKDIIDFVFGGGGIPCWSSYDLPEGCTHTFTRCAGCVSIPGIPDGPQSTCYQ